MSLKTNENNRICYDYDYMVISLNSNPTNLNSVYLSSDTMLVI